MAGDICYSNNECYSGNCTDGVCSAKVGTTCSKSADCGTGYYCSSFSCI